MTGPSEEKQSQIIIDDQDLECGCKIVTYADDRVEQNLCKYHKPMAELGQQLQQAGLLNRFLEHECRMLRKVVMAYKVLADGCPKHRDYRATKRLRPDCKGCKYMWQAKLYLDRLKKQTTEGDKPSRIVPKDHRSTQNVKEDVLETVADQASQELSDAIQDGDAAPFVPAGTLTHDPPKPQEEVS